MQAPTTLSIDLDALRHNLGEVQRCAPDSRVLAMLKADAYGHGLIESASALDKADAFAVARIDEAIALRRHDSKKNIVLLNANLNTDIANYCAENRIEVVIFDDAGAEAVLDTPLKKALNIWLKVDTGMHRLGITPDKIASYFNRLVDKQGIANITLMTHFSDSELADPAITKKQLQLFKQSCKGLSAKHSLANSAAIIQWPETHADWVRPGIMLYGATPILHDNTTACVNLRAAMSLRSQVLSVRDLQCGESVGYNGSWTAQRDSRIATIAIGYGDGYPRQAKNGTPVLINSKRFPLAGRVSMDLITVDITDGANIQPGDSVTLWGYDEAGNELSTNEIASCAGTVSYHLFTGVTARVQRRYSN